MKRVQCTVYSVQCSMYSKVVLLSLWKEPQCSSGWGVEPFARLMLCLTPPEDFIEQLSGTSKWSEIWLLGTLKWSVIWLWGSQNRVKFVFLGPQNEVEFQS